MNNDHVDNDKDCDMVVSLVDFEAQIIILPGSIPAGENSVRNFAFAFAVGLVLVLAGRRVRDTDNYFD